MRAIFWDNDGVLVDTERLYFRANAEILEREGIALNQELFRQHWLRDSQGLNIFALRFCWSPEKLEALRKGRNERYSELLRTEDLLVGGVRDTLASVDPVIIQGIVTSSRRDHFEIIHSRTGLLPFFSFVLAEGDYPCSKPAPDPYLAALKRAGVDASDAIVVEDSERGLRSAKAAGLRCLVLRHELNQGADLSEADALIDSVEDVLSYLD